MSARDILIVEDEPVVVQAAQKILTLEGLTVTAAEDGEVACERLRQGGYSTVLLDLMIPGVAGLALLESIRAERPDLPVIVTTGYTAAKKIVAVLRAGAFDFLPKPFDDEELLAVVRRALRHQEVGGRSRAGERKPAEGAATLYRLGAHSWAQVDEDGLATLGVTGAFVVSIEGSVRARLPGPGDETVQGMDFAALESRTGTHRVWAPLSGRVVESNTRLATEPELIRAHPFEQGWLTRVTPWNWDEERDELTVR